MSRTASVHNAVMVPSSQLKAQPEKQASESQAPGVGDMLCSSSFQWIKSVETAWPHRDNTTSSCDGVS